MESPSSSLPPLPSSQTDRVLAVLCHVCFFFGFIFLLPLIVFLVSRQAPWLREQAREALNFHISILIYAMVCVPLIFMIVGLPLLIILGLGSALLSIIAAVRAAEGALYRYPITIRMV